MVTLAEKMIPITNRFCVFFFCRVFTLNPAYINTLCVVAQEGQYKTQDLLDNLHTMRKLYGTN